MNLRTALAAFRRRLDGPVITRQRAEIARLTALNAELYADNCRAMHVAEYWRRIAVKKDRELAVAVARESV